MITVLQVLGMLIDVFKSRMRLEAENLFLRHQLNIALRRAPPRLRLLGSDRARMVWLVRLWPSLLGAAQVVKPRDDLALASCRLRSLLAMEIAEEGRAAKD